MKELTSLHTSMAAAVGKSRGKRPKQPAPPSDALSGSNNVYAPSMESNGGYDRPEDEPYSAHGSWNLPAPTPPPQPYIAYAAHGYIEPTPVYPAYPLSEAYPTGPNGNYMPASFPTHPATFDQGSSHPATTNSDPDSPLDSGNAPRSGPESLPSPLTPTSAQPPPSATVASHPYAPYFLNGPSAPSDAFVRASPVPTPPPVPAPSFRAPLHGVRDGAVGGELYPSVSHSYTTYETYPPHSHSDASADFRYRLAGQHNHQLQQPSTSPVSHHHAAYHLGQDPDEEYQRELRRRTPLATGFAAHQQSQPRYGRETGSPDDMGLANIGGEPDPYGRLRRAQSSASPAALSHFGQ